MSGRRALIIVDVQPTFCEGGELPVTGGNAVAARIGDYVSRHGSGYDLVVTSQDWHIDPTGHFAKEPDYEHTWPPHGLADSPNASLHPDLIAGLGATRYIVIKKGQHEAAYSAFDGADSTGASLAAILDTAGIEQVDICGIAESHCVRATALDARRRALATTLLTDLTVAVTAESGAQARADILAMGGRLELSESHA